MAAKKDLDRAILNVLKQETNYVSGERLAHQFKISRQALWKHISKLIDCGYEIIATPHLGYKLTSIPDKLYPWEIQQDLKTKFIGKKIHYNDTLESTQSIAWNLGIQQEAEGTLVVSETQTKGRGRLSRKWISPKGGIYFSLILKPKFLLIQEVPQITLLVALGCIYGIKKATGVECQVKWPNDIYLSGKKLGGILCEIHAEADKVNFVVAGIGINVNTKDLPQEATSLFLNTEDKASRLEIIKSILKEIETCYLRAQKEGFFALLREWESFCILWGKRISLKVYDKEIEGEAQGIDERGYLLLRQDTGLLEKISAADTVKVIVN